MSMSTLWFLGFRLTRLTGKVLRSFGVLGLLRDGGFKDVGFTALRTRTDEAYW